MRLGLPAWAYAGWQGQYFTDRPSALASYATVFDAVEGNTTFYAIPDPSTVARWVDAVKDTPLQFSFKLPATITHRGIPGATRPADRDHAGELLRFFRTLAPLGPCLGPFLVQFPASVGPRQLDHMQALFDILPAAHDYVVETRHPRFIAEPEALDQVLEARGYARVTLDTRALFDGDPAHPEIRLATHEKPDLPMLPRALGARAFVRLVLHPAPDYNVAVVERWVERIDEWLEQGVEVRLMVHCPNNRHCPPFARDIHERLRRRLDGRGVALPPLPAWPLPEQHELLF